MELSAEDVSRLARLAGLPPASAAGDAIRSDVQRLLRFVGSVQGADTSGVAPLLSLAEDEYVCHGGENGARHTPRHIHKGTHTHAHTHTYTHTKVQRKPLN